MTAPTPNTDPNGLAAAIVAFAGVLLTAADPSGLVGARWLPAITAGVALGALLWARRRTVSPATHAAALTRARSSERAQVVSEVRALAKPATAKKVAKKTSPVKKAAKRP